ncbi:hypothetical protein BB558_005572 [Smittium angustum]|uniref:Uncharacterized protein n=1 Tax=Smittium angustum TaxID=133377 RepID=A0A2U1J041_SMIAN|nr:hypothetical protein BB558_005572 [Smittium angustum]
MEPFGIYDSDVEPWVIPKYGSFFHYDCCVEVNFSTLDIEKYLGENITVDNIFEYSEFNDVYKQVKKSPDLQHNADKKIYSEYILNISKTIVGYSDTKNITKTIIFDNDSNISLFGEYADVLGITLTEIKEDDNISCKSHNSSFFPKEDQNTTDPYSKNDISKGNSPNDNQDSKLNKRKFDTMSLGYLLNDN